VAQGKASDPPTPNVFVKGPKTVKIDRMLTKPISSWATPESAGTTGLLRHHGDELYPGRRWVFFPPHERNPE